VYESAEATVVACATAHNAEFVGVFFGPDVPYPDLDKSRSFYVNGCDAVVAKFVGASNVASLRSRVGIFWRPPSEEEWADGDRGTGCYLWLEDAKVNRSLKGVGLAGLPR
jgi:hypothetical protein